MNPRVFRSLALAFLSAPALTAQQAEPPAVVINEIHYHPDVPTEAVEFIELFNAGTETADLSGWQFSDGINHLFPDGVTLAPGQFYILAQNVAAYNKKFGSIFLGGIKADAQWTGGTLSNSGERLTLRARDRLIADEVRYRDGFPWPIAADGGGASMELLHPQLDNDLAGHWRSSAAPSPGKQNTVFTDNPPPALRQVEHSPQAPPSGGPVALGVKATDADSVASVTLLYQIVEPGSYVRKSDAAFESSWESLPMLDDGGDTDAIAGDSIYGAVLPGDLIRNRHLVRYRIRAADTAGNEVTIPYPDDEGSNFAFFVYDGVPAWTGASRPGTTSPRTYTPEELGSLPVYHLVANGTDVINSQYNSSFNERRFLGTLVYDGVVYDHIQFRNRSEFSTYVSGKNKWRFYFNRGHDFAARDNYGRLYDPPIETMNFNACASPWVPANRGMAGLEEAVAFRLQDLAGVPSPNTHFLHYRIVDSAAESNPSDQYDSDLWGLYMFQEHPDDNMLSRLGLPQGNVYKLEGGNGDKTNQGPTQPLDNSDFTAFNTGSQRSQPESWWRENLNLDAYYSFRATNRITSNIDIREGWNHYFYHHPDNRWRPIPWDLDMMFMPETHWSGTIEQRRCLQVEPIAVEFRNRCRELLDLLYSNASAHGGQVGQVIEELARLLGPQLDWIDVASIRKATSVAYLTTAVPHGFSEGDTVRVVGANVAAYNGDKVVSVVSETEFSYPVSIFASPDVGGAIQAALQSAQGSAWASIDEAMWNYHPRTTGEHRGKFYLNPAQQSFQGGTLTRTLVTPDFGGFVQYVRDFTTDTDPNGWAIGDGDQRGYGYNYLESEAQDASTPDTPVIRYTGGEGFPADDLRFEADPFSGGTLFAPQEFAGMRWRLAEVSNPSTPGYTEGDRWLYEVTPVWESETSPVYQPDVQIPLQVVRPGSTYRVRVRYLNDLGRWSHWSAPVQFVAGIPDLTEYLQGIVVSELMYHPGPPSDAERALGWTDEDFEFVEVSNVGPVPLSLLPLRFTKGVDFDFADGSVAELQPGASVLVVRDAEAFAFRYGDNLPVAGSYGERNLSNSGETVKLSYGAGTPLVEFLYSDERPWPVEADGEGPSLELSGLLPAQNWNDPSAWRASSPGGTPGSISAPPSGDRDGDGASDAAEAVAGTNPDDPADYLRILTATRKAEGLVLQWSSVAGHSYIVQHQEILAAAPWTEVGAVTADGPVASFTDSDPARNGLPGAAYRIQALPLPAAR